MVQAGSLMCVARISRTDFGIAHDLGAGVFQKFLVLARHVGRRDLDHQPVFDPEFDDMEKRLLPLHAAAEGFGAPALAGADPLDLLAAQRHRDQRVKRPGLRRRLLAEHDLVVVRRNLERRLFRIDLDHRAVLVAARRHVGAFERPERKAFAVHQLGEHRRRPAPARAPGSKHGGSCMSPVEAIARP